jgi:hypothetical protein
MNLLVLMLLGCSPQDATLTDATYHVWLAEESSATIAEGKLSLDGFEYINCTGDLDEDTGLTLGVDYRCPYEEQREAIDGGATFTDDETIANLSQVGPFNWLDDDGYYLSQGTVEPWSTEALITAEGDFQITVHHDIGDGQDFRFAFVIDPIFQPSICIQEGQTCYSGQDDDGDGLADYEDPDCLYGGWEVGFDQFRCNDGVDNDGDGLIDLDDSGCDHAFDAIEANTDATCNDNNDNDGDGWIDDEDPDCATTGNAEDGTIFGGSLCNDGIDNDGDGFTDADDVATATDGGCLTAYDNDEGGFYSYDACADAVDNDGDGWQDDEDTDCATYGTEVGWGHFACNDGVDNDGDGLVDADDSGCLAPDDAGEEDLADSSCTNGNDDDGDGYADLDDPDCILGVAEDATYTFDCSDGDVASDASCFDAWDDSETSGDGSCTDDVDDDGDGWVGTIDPDCSFFLFGSEYGFSALVCNDGQDNDGDGFVDAADLDCLSPLQATEEAIDANCADEIDNDGDGYTDRYDADCIYGPGEDGTNNDAIECADGIDNDGDGLVDTADDDCSNGFDVVENSVWSCEDGIDNDGDGYIDNAEDPDCSERAFEYAVTTGQCNDGLDNDGDGDIDRDDSDCLNAQGAWEVSDQCADGIDNDGDGWLDANDPGCVAIDTPYEDDGTVSVYQCNDGQDNDGDGLTDSSDPDCTYAWDNIEQEQIGGDPIPQVLDYEVTLDMWSADEDGYTIYYLNAGAYQIDPAGESENYWVLPEEWLSGYAHAKYGAEEFDSQPTLYGGADPEAQGFQLSYVDVDYNDPDPDAYQSEIDKWTTTVLGDEEAGTKGWADELADHGLMNWDGFTMKIEDNQWRPIDISSAGLDNWIEMNTSWVRIKDGSTMEVDGQVSGDFQIYFLGRESGSALVVKGSFETNNIREDKWGYPVLEDLKYEENGTSACEF